MKVSVEYQALAPIIILLTSGVLAVLVEAFIPRVFRRPIQLLLVLGSIVLAFALGFAWNAQYAEDRLSNVLAVEGGGPLKKVSWRFTNLQGASSLGELIRGIRQPGATPTSPASPPAPGNTPAPGTTAPSMPAQPATPESKTDSLLRKVDQIGGLIKGIKQELKPAAPAAPSTPPAPAPSAPNP
jgi:NADH-quinone oxidoreductase subunit N